MYNVLADKQSQILINSANNFVYTYQENLDNESIEVSNYLKFNNKELNPQHIDFILQKENKNSNLYYYIYLSEKLKQTKKKTTLTEFVSNNPLINIQKYIGGDAKEYLYGRRITQGYLTDISRQIGSEIALIWNDFPSIVSSQVKTNNHLFALKKITRELESKNNFEIISSSIGSSNIVATIYWPQPISYKNKLSKFIIFTSIEGLTKLRSNLLLIILIIGFTGIVLSLILTLIFSNRIRNQLNVLSKAALFTGKGSLNQKIDIKTNDEVGELANAFNKMIDDLNKSEKAKKEYSDFIELVNQNPTLKEFSDATLSNIIKTGNFAIGALYNVEGENIKICSSYGVDEDDLKSKNVKFLKSVVSTKEMKELSLSEESITVSLGMVSVKIKQLLIIPIIYNTKVIGILELGAEKNISEELRSYLVSIEKQLAIGLTNANVFLHLEQMVTELKKLNDEFQNQNKQIKEQNKSLKDLHDQLKEKADELAVQKEKAEEATKLKSQFLASISHELRTPMNSILGLTELILEDSSLVNKDKERLEVVLKSGKRLMLLINDVLDLSKIEAGKMNVNYDTFVLNDLINDVGVNIKPLVKDKNILFKINKKTNTNIIVNSDGNKITQVLINLIGNAIKFTNEGFVQLTINLLPNNILEFKVDDTGIGISDKNKKIIFEEFRQADGSTTRKHSGTGLGLAISSKIVKLLKGSLQVTSEINKGSTFTFTLPVEVIELAKGKEQLKISVDQEKHKSTNGSIDTKEKRKLKLQETEPQVDKVSKHKPTVKISKKIENSKPMIMIVDDDADSLFTLNELVESLNYQTVLARDGLECIYKLKESVPDLILLDIMMPRMDGFQTLKKIKSNKNLENIPVIAVTARAMEEDKRIILKHGFDGYIPKPIDPLILTNKITTFFNKFKKINNA